jgi:hypothetical protein
MLQFMLCNLGYHTYPHCELADGCASARRRKASLLSFPQTTFTNHETTTRTFEFL